MFERMSTASMAVLQEAETYKARFNLAHLRAEDLLVALTGENGGLAQEVLNSYGITTSEVDLFMNAVDRIDGIDNTNDGLRFNRLLHSATAAADQYEDYFIEPFHLLVGIIKQRGGFSRICLKHYGVTTGEALTRINTGRELLLAQRVSQI
ncbi:MAG: Clp protease N-terminal domain-containing protein [Candidatus Saccharibacteria bacterium]